MVSTTNAELAAYLYRTIEVWHSYGNLRVAI